MVQQDDQTIVQEEVLDGDIPFQDEKIVDEMGDDPQQQEDEVVQIEEDSPLKEKLARLQADYDNFKKRTERDREEMVFFINSKTFSRILPRVDDLERIISNTPSDLRGNTLFSGVEALYKTLIRDIEGLGVKPFVSKGETVNPDRHDVMTQVPGEEGIIVDEFEKGYILGDRVIRHAKVVVGSGS